jgi:serine/threonine protein kinase
MCIGAFGNVRVCWIKGQPQHKYAIKTMKKADIIKSKHVDHIENEKKILERIEHPFIVSRFAIAAVVRHSKSDLLHRKMLYTVVQL